MILRLVLLSFWLDVISSGIGNADSIAGSNNLTAGMTCGYLPHVGHCSLGTELTFKTSLLSMGCMVCGSV